MSPIDRIADAAARAWRRSVSVGMGLYHHDAALKATAMAFDLFLGLLPLAAIAGWALARFGGSSSAIDTVVSIAPGPAADLVREQIQRLVQHGGTIAPLSFLGFIWVASSGIHTAMSSIQTARTGTTRGWPLNRVISMGVVVVMLALITASTIGLVYVETWLRAALIAGHIEREFAMLARSGAFVLSTAVTTAGVAAFFELSTHGMEPGKRTVWPGSLTFASLWVTVSWLFSAYVTALGRYSLFYGSLAAVALLMLWLWLSSFLLLIGFELNLQLEGRRKTIAPPSIRLLRRRHPPLPGPPKSHRTPPPPPAS